MNAKENVAIYIDGSNLYYKLKSLEITNKTKYDYKGLCDYLARDRKIVLLNYYVGIIRAQSDNVKGQILRKQQVKLFNHLLNQGFKINKGYIMENDGAYHEKGVDVKIAVDILIGAYEKSYDTAILLSSDTDLIPAIKKAKELGRKIEYIGFSHQPSFGLQKYATRSLLLPKEDLDKFEVKKLV